MSRPLFCFTLVALAIAATPAHAQIAAALGKPLPSTDLPTGTLVVRAIVSSISDPIVGRDLTLTVDGKPRKVQTDASGRARFDGLAVGATVKATITDDKGRAATSDAFQLPADSGVRVIIATAFVDAPLAPPLPAAREISGRARAIDKLASHALEVRLTYDDLRETKAPTGVTVALVGYAAAGGVTMTTKVSDGHGEATFDHLDPATAYYVFAELPRNSSVDRLASEPILLDGTIGSRVVLSGEKRDSKAKPVDDLATWDAQPAVAADHVRVALVGAADETSTVTVVDAATAKPVATATIKRPDDHADIAIKSRPGQVLYAETTSSSHRYRSHPFQTLPRTGTTTSLFVMSPLLASYEFFARANDPDLEASVRVTMTNYTWMPVAIGADIPLPRGFTKAEIDNPEIAITPVGFSHAGLLAPRDHHFIVSFVLPSKANVATWSLDLPWGAWKSRFAITNEPGVSIAPPVATTIATVQGTEYLVANFDITPKQSMAMTIQIPKLPPLERTCRKLHPESSPLVGKSALEWSLPLLEGTGTLTLSSLRGKIVLLNMTASWDGVARNEWPTFAHIGLIGVVTVVMFSDKNRSDVAGLVDAAKSRVVLDAPIGDSNIGPTTLAWGTKALPESYLIDRQGVVRYYIVNWRDWSSPDAKACLRALADQ